MDAPPTPRALRRLLGSLPAFTVGVEEELMLVDGGGELAPVAADVLARLGDGERFAPEALAAHVEVRTPPCATPAEAVAALAAGRAAVRGAAAPVALVAGAGTHPTARADDAALAPGPLAAGIVARYGWPARRAFMAAGLHVHVAVPGADRAVAVHDALRAHMPALVALAANAPFFEGADTGLATVRPKLADMLPRQGVPPRLGSPEALAALLLEGAGSGSWQPRRGWWECRIHPVLGTVEVRASDAQTRLADAAAVVALVHALVVHLARRHDAGERLPAPSTALVAENRARALAAGLDAPLADPAGGPPAPARDRLEALLAEVEPSPNALDGARRLLADPPSDRQRAAAREGGIGAVAGWLARETDAMPGTAGGR